MQTNHADIDRFPNLTAAFVKDTLGEKFAQVGKTKSDKKWVFEYRKGQLSGCKNRFMNCKYSQ